MSSGGAHGSSLESAIAEANARHKGPLVFLALCAFLLGAHFHMVTEVVPVFDDVYQQFDSSQLPLSTEMALGVAHVPHAFYFWIAIHAGLFAIAGAVARRDWLPHDRIIGWAGLYFGAIVFFYGYALILSPMFLFPARCEVIG